MYVDKVPNRNSKPTYLIRESKRNNGKTDKTTLANITKLPLELIEQVRILLKGGFVYKNFQESIKIQSIQPHGHVCAIVETMKNLGLPELIDQRNTRFRRLILGMMVHRLLKPYLQPRTEVYLDQQTAKTSINDLLDLKDVDEDDIHRAMNQLLKHKDRIESDLAKRHIIEDGLVLCGMRDISRVGEQNEDPISLSKKGKKRAMIGLITDQDGIPVGMDIVQGKSMDKDTLSRQLHHMTQSSGSTHLILVGDHKILNHKNLSDGGIPAGLDWMASLKKSNIRAVVEQENIHKNQLDQHDCLTLQSDLYPGEKLVIWINPNRSTKNKKRKKRMVLTEKRLDSVIESIQRKKNCLIDKDDLIVQVYQVLITYNTEKFFHISIDDRGLSYSRNHKALERADLVDRLCIIRTSRTDERGSDDLVASFYRLSALEMALSRITKMHLHSLHDIPKHLVRANIFLCTLAYYVEYHMRCKLAPLLYEEEVPTWKHPFRMRVSEAIESSVDLPHNGDSIHVPERIQAMSFEGVMEILEITNRLLVLPKVCIDPKPEVMIPQELGTIQTLAFQFLEINIHSKTGGGG